MVASVIDRIKRWLGGPSADPPGPPIAAVTLPSGDVVVFDRVGHVLNQARGPSESLKESISRDVGTSGRYFRVIGETTAGGSVRWEGSTSDYLPGRLRWENEIQVEFTAIECTGNAWLAGGLEGQPAGRASFLVDRKHPLAVTLEDVWTLVRDAALRASS